MISIIIPVYNREHTLRRCIDSIIAQHYNNWECIIVDDGSKDDSYKISQEFANKDARFIVIRKPNGGVSSARNAGLQVASGEWIVFVDSDDYIKADHLASLNEAAFNDVDLVFTGFESMGAKMGLKHAYKKGHYVGLSEVKQFICQQDFVKYQLSCDRMYRRSLIVEKGISFQEKLRLSEDRLFAYHFLIGTKGISSTDRTTYVIDSSDLESLSHSIPDISMQVTRYNAFAKALKELIKHYQLSKAEKEKYEAYNLALLDLLCHTPNSPLRVLKTVFLAFCADKRMFINYCRLKISNKIFPILTNNV